MIIIISITDNNALYCGSKDLIIANTRGHETGYCIFSGKEDY